MAPCPIEADRKHHNTQAGRHAPIDGMADAVKNGSMRCTIVSNTGITNHHSPAVVTQAYQRMFSPKHSSA